jgi:predicted dehydrogenase
MAKKLKIGLIGTGGIAQACHIPGYKSMPDDCEVVWACDANEEVAKKVAAEHGIANVTTDYKDVLADASVDAVSVTTPNKFHKQPTVDSLTAGKHVLCEKPLAMNGAEAREMCKAARDSGKILQVALQQRFSGAGQFMQKFIADGGMGDIYYARAQALRRRGVPAWGVFIDKEQQGGGPLIDIGVHILDFTLTMMGYPKPVSASGMTWDALGKNPELYNMWGDYDRTKFTVEDMAVGFIRFENGALVVLESSFMSNLDGNPYGTQLFGTKAGAKIYFDQTFKGLEIYTEHHGQLFNMTPINVPDVKAPHTEEIVAFVRAIQSNGPSPVPGEQGLILNAIFDALYKSAVTGAEEKIDVSF